MFTGCIHNKRGSFRENSSTAMREIRYVTSIFNKLKRFICILGYMLTLPKGAVILAKQQ